jgi:elongation factor Ts
MDTTTIKKLREETGAGIMAAKNALETHGDYEKAKEELMAKGLAKVEKRQDREATEGLVYSYIHSTGKLGSMVVITCETDFVARNETFVNLCKEVALQVATANYETVEELLKDEYIKDSSKTIEDLVKEASAKLGEKMELTKFARLEV